MIKDGSKTQYPTLNDQMDRMALIIDH